VLDSTVRAVLLVPMPPGPVITTVATPATAAAGTTKVSVVALVMVGVAARPFTVTPVAPIKLVPVTVTTVPGRALVGAMLMMVGAVAGAAVTIKGVLLVAVPVGEVTVMVPVCALAGTLNVIVAASTTVKPVTATVPNCTAVVPKKPVPLSVTTVPGMPLVGLKAATLVTVGGKGEGLSPLQLASHKLPSTALAPL
jgi:hypothetical protein